MAGRCRGRAPRGTGGRHGASTVPGESCPRCGAARDGQFCESCGYDFTPSAGPGSALRPGRVPGRAALPLPRPQVPDAWAASAEPAAPGPDRRPADRRRRPPCSRPRRVAGPRGAVCRPALPAGRRPPAGAAWTAVVTADRAYYDAIQAAGGPDAAGIAFPAYCPQRRFRLAGAEVRIGRHSASSGIDPEIDLSVPPADPGVSRLHAVLLEAADGTWSVVDPGSANGTAGQRHRDRPRPGRATARRRPDPPGRLDRAAGRPRGLARAQSEHWLTGR